MATKGENPPPSDVVPVLGRLHELTLVTVQPFETTTGTDANRKWKVLKDKQNYPLFTAITVCPSKPSSDATDNEDWQTSLSIHHDYPLVVRIVEGNRKYAAEVHSPAGNVVAYLTGLRGGRVYILNTDLQVIHDIVAVGPTSGIFSCFYGSKYDERYNVHPPKKKENMGGIEHISTEGGSKVTMPAVLDVVSRAALISATMLIYHMDVETPGKK